MKRIALIAILLFLGTTSFSQYCELGGPSSTADSNLGALSIVGASGSINFTGCPGVTGVQYYTAETVTLSAGASYVLNLQFGTCGGNFSSVAEVWIDYNGNNVFETSESVVTWSGQPMGAPTGYVITVPANSVAGMHRMRVMQAEQSTLPLDPCAGFTWGSVTDFNVTLTGGIDCSGYIGDDRFNPRVVGNIPFSENHNSSICYSNQSAAYVSPDVFYKIVPNGLGAIKVSLCGSTFDTFLSIQDQNGMAIYGNDDAGNCGTSSEIEFPTAGYDTVFAVVEGWGVASGDYTIVITEGSLDLSENELTIGMHPNPANNIIYLESAQNGNVQFFSTQGRLIYETILNNDFEIDVSHLPRGLYMVKLIGDQQVSQQKIILE
ncbi:T9SS type A sorting domain-containing protein [Crocinitomicaceae bacterium]|nr:T9SS type A sorting domain-containing protein [Crocinitomicaceae bacterium]